MGFALTGSSAATLALARRKDRVNELLEKKGLPIPRWGVWNGTDAVAWAGSWSHFPAIVKPVAEDGSVGISQSSVVGNREELTRRLPEVAAHAPLLVQAFVGTREINAAIVRGEVLALSEIVFESLPRGHHALVDYTAKWAPGSPEDLGTRPVCPAPLPRLLAARIRLLALMAWRAVGGRSYGRVDFRLSPPGCVHVLEVNPNPDLAPSAGLARAAEAVGVSYASLIERILLGALVQRERSA